MLRDNLIYNSYSRQISLKCAICKSYSHQKSIECPYLHYIPDY